MSSTLIASPNFIETPFVWVTLGGVTFSPNLKSSRSISKDYPNIVESLEIKRLANSTTNSYTVTLVYVIQPGMDPNMMDKVFSKAAKMGRKMYLSYGDSQVIDYCHKTEECLILDIKPDISMTESKITYTVKAESTTYQQSQTTFYFPDTTSKPSSEIIRILKNTTYRLHTIFTGLQHVKDIESLVASDDKVVRLQAQTTTALGRIKYLVSCMESEHDTRSVKSSIYRFAIYDNDTYKGPYISVKKFTADTNYYNADVEINIGYPKPREIIDFKVDVSNEYSILYEYGEDIEPTLSYIDDLGEIQKQTNVVNPLSRNVQTQQFNSWWNNMVSFPISATLELRGLLRSITLLDTILINVYFWGQKHIYSGVYGITSQNDKLNSSGYRTTLKLLRLGGTDYVTKSEDN